MGVRSRHHREFEEFEEFAADARTRLRRAYLVVRGVHGADDAASEALTWAWEHRSRLKSMNNPVGYLYRVGLSRSIPKHSEPSLPTPAAVNLPDMEPGLIPALLKLPENQRAAVWLVHACGWSYAEVAKALGIGRSTVGTHVTRALAALREDFEVTRNA